MDGRPARLVIVITGLRTGGAEMMLLKVLERLDPAWRPHVISLTDVGEMVDEARQVLRGHYFRADVGITGGNFLIAETGEGAAGWASGSQTWSGTRPALAPKPASASRKAAEAQNGDSSCARMPAKL